jgi:hypothetical protein
VRVKKKSMRWLGDKDSTFWIIAPDPAPFVYLLAQLAYYLGSGENISDFRSRIRIRSSKKYLI